MRRTTAPEKANSAISATTEIAHKRARTSPRDRPSAAPVQRAEGVEHGVRGLHGAGRHQEDQEQARAQQAERRRRARAAAAWSRPSAGRARSAAAGRARRQRSAPRPPTTSQMADAGPSRSTTQPPQKLAAMKLSEPHSRMRP